MEPVREGSIFTGAWMGRAGPLSLSLSLSLSCASNREEKEANEGKVSKERCLPLQQI